LSGGLDSSTTAAIAKHKGFDVFALTFDYGQRHQVEVKAAQKIAEHVGVARQMICPIDMQSFGGSALTSDLSVPKGRTLEQMEGGIPVTYVPARNTIFLSFALAWAEVLEANDLFIGVNAVDYSGYPDCRPEFVEAFERMARLATRAGVERSQKLTIHAPLIHLSKAAIIKRGVELGVDYSLTVSCYDPSGDGRACGQCDACLLRKKGFSEAGIEDPTEYVNRG
jgi:7-cyano-7-deazaguanine synthase